LKFCGGLKVEGRINFDVSGFVKFPFSAHRAVDVKERTAAPIANNLILKSGGRPAQKSNRSRRKISRVGDGEVVKCTKKWWNSSSQLTHLQGVLTGCASHSTASLNRDCGVACGCRKQWDDD
jgi:hypothetical protein